MVNHSINPLVMERRITGAEAAVAAASEATAALDALKKKEVNIFLNTIDGTESNPTVYTPTKVIVDKNTVFPNKDYVKQYIVNFVFNQTQYKGGSWAEGFEYEVYFKIENLVNNIWCQVYTDCIYAIPGDQYGKANVECVSFCNNRDASGSSLQVDALYKISFKTKPDPNSSKPGLTLRLVFQPE